MGVFNPLLDVNLLPDTGGCFVAFGVDSYPGGLKRFFPASCWDVLVPCFPLLPALPQLSLERSLLFFPQAPVPVFPFTKPV